MKRKYWKVLSKEDLQKIHHASLAILEKTGMRIDHTRARRILEEAGAKVDHNKKLVKFPPQLVEKCLQGIPRTLVYAGRNPRNDVCLKVGGDVFVRTTSGPTSYINLKTGRYRRAKIADMKEFAILGDALPNINGNGTLHAGDVPERTADIHSLKVLLENTEKHLYAQSFSPKNLKYMIEMTLAVRGSREELKRRPLFHTIIGIISPLFLPKNDVDMLFLAGEYGIPTGMCSMPIAGATAPLTLAGTLAQGNAEVLAALTLSQVAYPGQPCPYYWIPMIADMRTGAGLLATSETFLLNSALSQLGGELYGMPVMAAGLANDTVISEQVAMQKAQNALITCLGGANLIICAGATDSGLAFSPVQLVIDDEIMGMTRRVLRGIETSDETIGLEAIDRVGPQGNFLTEEHTLRHIRSDEYQMPTLFDRDSHAAWQSKGAKNLEQKARKKALTILKEHEIEPLSKDVLKELRSIEASADKELAA